MSTVIEAPVVASTSSADERPCDSRGPADEVDECSDGGKATWRLTLLPCGCTCQLCELHAGDVEEMDAHSRAERARRKLRGSAVQCTRHYERVSLKWERL